jgi:hypothetical protein
MLYDACNMFTRVSEDLDLELKMEAVGSHETLIYF